MGRLIEGWTWWQAGIFIGTPKDPEEAKPEGGKGEIGSERKAECAINSPSFLQKGI